MMTGNGFSWLSVRSLLILVSFWAGVYCAVAAEETASPSAGNTNDTLYRIQIGDVIKITLRGPPDLENQAPIEQKVKENGTISLQYIGQVKAADLTASKLEQDIQNAYVPKYYKHLSVVVVTENRYYYVGGEVRKPDRFPHVSEITVCKAIDSAGGFTEYAKKTEVTVQRLNGKIELIDCKKALKDPKLDLPVYPGDKINVPRRMF